MRPSSEQLQKNLIKGLTDSGLDVVDIGLNTTPTFYFGVSYYQHDGGIQITASHNPSEYNGFKLARSKARPLGEGTGMEELREIVSTENFINTQNKGKVEKFTQTLKDQVKEALKQANIKKIKPFKIVVDAGNSVGALDMKAIFEHLPCELIPLYFELDGTFPNHDADPLKPENLIDLQQEVENHNADLGIALDGDGDRMFFIDEKGDEVPQSILRGIMAQIALKENPGETVCYDIRPGKITQDMIDEVGGEAVITKVGHSLIKAKMEEVNAVFGGESSGHYFYKFNYGTFDMPLVLLVKFLQYISEQNKPVSEIIKPYKKYFHSGEINSTVEDKEAVMKKLTEIYNDGEISHLDGVTITFDDYWFNVRPSNTEPKLRLNLEAVSQEIMEKKRDEILKIIRG
jgi:phosphomannomutase